MTRAYTTASKGRAGDDSYRALLELSTEAIARFELQSPMRVDLAPDEQVEHILRHACIAAKVCGLSSG